MPQKRIFVVAITDAEGEITERLVRADTPTKAMHHCISAHRPSAEEVARYMGAGKKIEDAAE